MNKDFKLLAPNGRICYLRDMIPSDTKYIKGMVAIFDLETDEMIMRHFDNVYYNAIKKGYKDLRN